MNAIRRYDGLALLSIGGASAITAALYDQLPERIATHFNLAGDPDGWMPRAYGAWLLLVFATVVWVAVRFALSILPRWDRARVPPATLAFVAMITAGLMSAVHLLVLCHALRPATRVNQPVYILVGMLFIVLGFIMPRTRRNPVLGIRTVWTLTSDENWARTHRLAGYTMVIGGLVSMLGGVMGGREGGVLAVMSLVVSAIIPSVYSLVLARRGT